MNEQHRSVYAVLRHFRWEHLPPYLQRVSRPFCELAQKIVGMVEDDPQLVEGLQKLLEAKDAVVRAAVVDRENITQQKLEDKEFLQHQRRKQAPHHFNLPPLWAPHPDICYLCGRHKDDSPHKLLSKPHMFDNSNPVDQEPDICYLCGRPENDSLHTKPHAFDFNPVGQRPESCAKCGRDKNDPLHAGHWIPEETSSISADEFARLAANEDTEETHG